MCNWLTFEVSPIQDGHQTQQTLENQDAVDYSTASAREIELKFGGIVAELYPEHVLGAQHIVYPCLKS